MSDAAKALLSRATGPMTVKRARRILVANGLGLSDAKISELIKPPPKKKAKTKKVSNG